MSYPFFLWWRNSRYRLWAVYVTCSSFAACVAVFQLDDLYPGNRIGATVALTGITAWMTVLGPDFYESRVLRRRAVVFVAGSMLLFVVALTFSGNAMAALPVMYPLIFLSLPLSAALVVVCLANVVPIVFLLIRGLPPEPDLAVIVTLTMLCMFTSALIGIVITRNLLHTRQQAMLVEQLETSRAEIAHLSHEAGSAAERARLAREIHDTLAQGFTSIVTLVQAIEREFDTDPAKARQHVSIIGDAARENLAEARAMVTKLTPATLTHGLLIESIRRHSDRLADEAGIAVTVTATESLPTLSTPSEVVLLRATQEAFANIARHSEASAVAVELAGTASGVRLSVADNGIGIPLEDQKEGFGLRGMRERAKLVGGRMWVQSSPWGGTRIAVEVPA